MTVHQLQHIGLHLKALESEAIYILREVAGQFERPILLFSGGKDSIVLAHLARKAFWPARLPFPLLHIDTGHNFPETLAFRDEFVQTLQAQLIVRFVQDTLDAGHAVEESGPSASRNALQTITLLDALKALNCDAALGGARRDEEKARTKERIFSHRDRHGQWDPKNQRPELWNLYNAQKKPDEHFRVFPLSNWTELDIWYYIAQENIPLPTIYFAHEREVVNRAGVLLAKSPYIALLDGETYEKQTIRYRTLGDMTCTGATLSQAETVEAIIAEVATAQQTERGNRADDHRSDAALEDRKRVGYF